MKLTRQHLATMYYMLAAMPPFTRYKLPSDAKIDFKINRSKMLCGSYEVDPHTITISRVLCHTYQQVLETLAHEMVHLALEQRGASDHSDHDVAFNNLAAEVCTLWGWNFPKF